MVVQFCILSAHFALSFSLHGIPCGDLDEAKSTFVVHIVVRVVVRHTHCVWGARLVGGTPPRACPPGTTILKNVTNFILNFTNMTLKMMYYTTLPTTFHTTILKVHPIP